MSELAIHINRTQNHFTPGETIAGRATWSLDATAPEAIELRLFWYTEGKGTRNTDVVATERVERPAKSGELTFGFQLPDGPHSFSGKLISLLWALEIVVLPSEESQRVNVVVSPTRAEINLYSPTSAI